MQMISDIVSSNMGPGMLQQNVGIAMLTKTLDVQKTQANQLLYAMLPANSITPGVGAHLNTYA
ncbi:MAG: YjfB family protein [Armatimonadota bacterium]